MKIDDKYFEIAMKNINEGVEASAKNKKHERLVRAREMLTQGIEE